MDAQRLEHIIRTRRGITYLVRRLLEVDNTQTHHEAKKQLRKIWDDKSLTDEETYKQLAAMLVVDDVSISREQFMQMIEKAIDHSEDYFLDPLEAVHMLTGNMLKQGGMKSIARRLDMFTKKI